MNGDTQDIQPRDVIYSQKFQEADPETRIKVINEIAKRGLSKDPFFKNFSSYKPDVQLSLVQRMTSQKVQDAHARADETTIGPENPLFSITVGSGAQIPVYQSQWRKALSVLPWAGGAAGGALGAPGLVTGVGGAALGGAGGQALEDILLRVSGLTPAAERESSGGEALEIGKQGLYQAGAEATGKLAGPLVSRMAKGLQTGAESQIGRVLQPTTKASKAITERQLEKGLLERGVVARSRQQLFEQAAQKSGALAEDLEKAWEAIPADKKFQTQPIVATLDDMAKKLGTDVSVEAERAAKGLKPAVLDQRLINQFERLKPFVQQYGEEISPKSLRALRQVWDRHVREMTFAKRAAGLDVRSEEFAEYHGANIIRDLLNKSAPEVAAINKELNFWLNVKKVMGETLTRKAGQEASPLTSKVARAAAGAAGIARGGVGMGAEYYGVMYALDKAVLSTGWRTVSANAKYRLARMMLKDPEGATKLLYRIVGTTGAVAGAGEEKQ